MKTYTCKCGWRGIRQEMQKEKKRDRRGLLCYGDEELADPGTDRHDGYVWNYHCPICKQRLLKTIREQPELFGVSDWWRIHPDNYRRLTWSEGG